jgi:predicted peroxiredoxin
MAHRVLVNLTTGMEDEERVMLAFLVAGAALDQGKEVVIFCTQEAVRLGIPGVAEGVPCKDCPPIDRLFSQFSEKGGELWLCPFCVNARDLGEETFVDNSKIAGATPMWEWLGDAGTVIGY